MSNPTDDLNRLRDLEAKIALAETGVDQAKKAYEKPPLQDAWNLNPAEKERLRSNLETRKTELKKLKAEHEALIESGGRPEPEQK